ncbi:hypothetical protein LEP1GSC047_2701 [Leptospira inadai serovar Lyme str. 10]|uniref:Glycosyltransferase family 28 C-terminal domain protein n=2 Tax=Leptospira inadai serovar Lyme TaxID=293084 RepID=V6HIK9_9LEPT|nr:hypothetical protein LEP1GSC047_2701 [Leptospira inadai serovar Lyme str. 10]PNV76501.1 UDP-2,4-diacetamido-2,4,6-trideoxy-beta-L-altropyranose hydrolase [Leptospira inadai serovar Lyme]
MFIFTECLSNTGLGHLRRCTALAEIINEIAEDVFIVLHTDGTGLSDRFPVSIVVLDWKNREQRTAFLEGKNVDAIFVDSYLADEIVYEELQAWTKNLICIDDTNRIRYPIGSTILNPGYGGIHLEYDASKNRIATGGEYVLLRHPFREKISFPSTKENVESVLITVGGEDRWNLVPRILEIINADFPKWKKKILLGPAFLNLDEIKKKSDENTVLHSGLSAQEIRELMLSVDFAITAGGQTTYELLKCRVPMIIIETAENQRENIRGLSTEIPGLAHIDKDLISLRTESKRIVSYSFRNDLRERMRKTCLAGNEKIRSLLLC